MANKLSSEKINELWLAFQEKQNVQYVAKKCHVSKKTVERYRQKEDWDKRFAEIKQEATEIADMNQARQNAKYIKIAEKTIDIYLQSLVKTVTHTCPKCSEQIKITVPKTAITPTHFDKMVRLIREEINIKEHEQF